MVSDTVWNEVGSPAGFLCVDCLERRLGRCLAPDDFIVEHINEPSPWDTVRLASRKAGLPESVLSGRWPP